ncbi:MAG: hypothetical protein RHS_0816 [Robinsoniella sp. RHS]|uniref:PssE/Cps14G family polysaccharide biosynthesis glycosyltransferase n=1 Tax=Robinsoniella sp. RHS TaxID=1504536 RepID=UPI0006596C31|nr:MAG: hypothetical protein RHS_0816 [Robinsoniella sp. RHS]
MIFVTVGSQKFPFDRLLIEVDRLIGTGVIKEAVYAQTGYSQYIPVNYTYRAFLNQTEMEEKISESSIIITHGGTGIIVRAIKAGKKVVAVPRKKEYHEHIDNHQVELLSQFEAAGFICFCRETADLANKLEAIEQFTPLIYNSNTESYIKNIGGCLDRIQAGKQDQSAKKRFGKYIEYLTTKIKIMFHQKYYWYENTTVKYLFEKMHSDAVIFVFSSCTRAGIKARYNYVRTLKRINADKMFVLDDGGNDARGLFYLGENMDFFVERAVESLIKKTISEGRYKKIIFAGSSKGGYAAINFGVRIPGSTIIAGAPQYRLGDYLMDENNRLEQTLVSVTGCGYLDADQDKLEKLNNHLRVKILDAVRNNKENHIYLHYSKAEHTYSEHIKFMLMDLETGNFSTKKEILYYENHSDISLYFPDFLVRSIEEVMACRDQK